jgi:hypothetical protein
MDVIVDGDRSFDFSAEPEDVLAAVAVVSEYLRTKNRAIMQVQTDGEGITPERMESSLKNRPLSTVTELTIRSAELGDLVTDCLDSLQEVLPELPKACHDLAALFQGEHPAEGFNPLVQLLEIWGHVKGQEQLVVQALDLAPDAISIEGTTLEDHHSDLNGYLEETEAALKENDAVLLGDLLEYELAPRAEKEVRIVDLLRERARQGA